MKALVSRRIMSLPPPDLRNVGRDTTELLLIVNAHGKYTAKCSVT